MDKLAESYPLQWPTGFPRTREPTRSRFHAPAFGDARDGLLRELERLGATDVILSSNIPLKRDGMPYANQKPSNGDAGIAVYFRMHGKQPRSLACDKWSTPQENIHALELTVAAMRGLDRWGASDMLDRVFSGFAALPDLSGTKPWWEELRIPKGSTLRDVEAAFRERMKRAHPDHGGSHDAAQRLTNAMREARNDLR